jgi:hypothetical protein
MARRLYTKKLAPGEVVPGHSELTALRQRVKDRERQAAEAAIIIEREAQERAIRKDQERQQRELWLAAQAAEAAARALVEKKCRRCCKPKPLSEFGSDRTHRDGKRSWCLHCEREKNAEKLPQRRARRDLWNFFKLRPQEKAAIIKAQGDACGRCRTPFIGRIRPQIDHDWSCCPTKKCCGKCVRGIICNRCNSLLNRTYCKANATTDPYLIAYAQRRVEQGLMAQAVAELARDKAIEA